MWRWCGCCGVLNCDSSSGNDGTDGGMIRNETIKGIFECFESLRVFRQRYYTNNRIFVVAGLLLVVVVVVVEVVVVIVVVVVVVVVLEVVIVVLIVVVVIVVVVVVKEASVNEDEVSHTGLKAFKVVIN